MGAEDRKRVTRSPPPPTSSRQPVAAQTGNAHGAGHRPSSRTSHGATSRTASEIHERDSAKGFRRPLDGSPAKATSAPIPNSQTRAGSEKNATFASVMASIWHAMKEAATIASRAAMRQDERSLSR